MKKIALILVPVLGLGVSACSGMSNKEQRALSGGAIGAGGGALIGAAAGAPLTGALIGGAAGAATGALTGKDDK